MTLRQLRCAVRGYRARKREEWEMVRVQAAYALAPHSKKHIKYSDIKLPIDEAVEVKTNGTKKTLTREEIKAAYDKAGFEVTEEFLDRILKERKKK